MADRRPSKFNLSHFVARLAESFAVDIELPAVPKRTAPRRRNPVVDVTMSAVHLEADCVRAELIIEQCGCVHCAVLPTTAAAACASVVLAPPRPQTVPEFRRSSASKSYAVAIVKPDLSGFACSVGDASIMLAIEAPRTMANRIEEYRVKSAGASPSLTIAPLKDRRKSAAAVLSLRLPRVIGVSGAGRSTMALTRRRERALNSVSFMAEQRRLAAAVNTPLDDILWIGLFRLVPIAAAKELTVDEKRGVLSVVLKDNAAEMIRKSRPQVVSLAMGRNKHTRAIVQALIS